MNAILRKKSVLFIILCIFCCTMMFSTYHFIKRFNKKNTYARWILTANSGIDAHVPEDWRVFRMGTKERCGDFQMENLENGVLSVLQHGGKFIYLTPRVNDKTWNLLRRFHFGKNMSAIIYTGNYSNPLQLHFNVFSNTSSFNGHYSLMYELGVWKTALLQKVFIPSEKTSHNLDERSPTMLLPVGKMCPFTKTNILFHYDAFWAILPLNSNDFRWSVWVQKLLQELGSFVSFTSVGKVQNNCGDKFPEHSNINNDLNEWHCIERSSFFSCVISLSKFMVEKGYMTNNENLSITTWLDKLSKAKYQQPALTSSTKGVNSLEKTYRVFYYPTFMMSNQNLNSKFQSICNQAIPKCPSSLNMSAFKPLDNILLVVVFNRMGHYGGLDYMESIYRSHFKYILYCGPNMENLLPHYKNMTTPVSFVEVRDSEYHLGQLTHHCVQKAIRMNYNVEGYLHVAEDVLFNIWNLHGLPTDKIWYQQSMRVANVSQPKVNDVWRNPSWWPWESSLGHDVLAKALKNIEQLSGNDSFSKSFLDELAKNANGKYRAFYEVSDIYYIPQILAEKYLYFVKIFSAHNVYTEITVPTIMNGLADQTDIIRFNGTYLWYSDRVLYREKFKYTSMFLHSLKPGLCFPDVKCRTFICEKYVSCIADLNTL